MDYAKPVHSRTKEGYEVPNTQESRQSVYTTPNVIVYATAMGMPLNKEREPKRTSAETGPGCGACGFGHGLFLRALPLAHLDEV